MKTARPAAAMGALLAASLMLGDPAAARAQSEGTSFSAPAFGERSLYLLHIPFLEFGPADPLPLAPGTAVWLETSAYASTFSSSWHALSYHKMFGLVGQPLTQSEVNRIHRDFPQDQVFLVEGDVLRESLTGRFGITPTLVGSLELVYVSHSAVHGLSSIESFHRAFGFSQAGRDEFPPDAFAVLLQEPGGPISFDGRTPASGWGDTVAMLGWRPGGPGPWRCGADLAVKAPTGSARDYNGSGSWDGGALGYLQRAGERWVLDAEAGLVIPGRWNSRQGLETAPFGRLMLAATRRFGMRTCLGVSATVEESPFRGEAVGDVSRAGGEVALGVSHDFPHHWMAALTLSEHIAPLGDRADFGFALRLGYR